MDVRNLERLKAEQLSAIEKTKERITQLEKYKNDYGDLKKRLKTLPDKVTHDVMVPFGKLAFMPGRLIHTNEITVLLGDNWFAEVSAKDAIGISERRVTDINRQIAELNKQKGLLEPRVDFTSQLHDITQNAGDLIEITEEYDAEKEKIWKEQHAENVRQYRQRKGDGRCQVEEEEEVWRRLEVLERQELESDELGRCYATDDDMDNMRGEGHGDESHPRKKSVTWENEKESTSSSGESLGEDGSTDTDEEEQSLDSVIYFSHTKQPFERSSPDSSSGEDDSTVTIRSPADIYQQYLNTLKPKSILKVAVQLDQQSEMTPVTTPAWTADTTSVFTPNYSISQHMAEAFSRVVVERDVGDGVTAGSSEQQARTSGNQDIRMEPCTDGSLQLTSNLRQQTLPQGRGSDSQQVTDVATPPKRVSKFRAQRMQQEKS